jgi:hypothetical protein
MSKTKCLYSTPLSGKKRISYLKMNGHSKKAEGRERISLMHLKRFWYIPEVEVEFTKSEVDALCKASDAHYDFKCKQAGEPGGVLWGLKNRIEAGSASMVFKQRDFDLLAKIAEQFSLISVGKPEQEKQAIAVIAAELWVKFARILNKMNDEYSRLNPRDVPNYTIIVHRGGVALERSDYSFRTIEEARQYAAGKYAWDSIDSVDLVLPDGSRENIQKCKS